MPRKKSYDQEQALRQARDAFMQNGYERLGVRRIGELTGVNRFALQTEFNGKQGLFLKVLEAYASDARDTIVSPIQSGGLAAIKQFFVDLTQPGADGPSPYGCLMVNTVVENAGLNDDCIRARTQAHFNAMIRCFETALNRAKAKGELAAGFDVKPAAEYLLATAMGIQVFVRMHGAVASATALGQVAIATISAWQAQQSAK